MKGARVELDSRSDVVSFVVRLVPEDDVIHLAAYVPRSFTEPLVTAIMGRTEALRLAHSIIAILVTNEEASHG